MTRFVLATAFAFAAAGCAGGSSPDDKGGVPGEKVEVTAKSSGDEAAVSALERGGALEKQGKGSEAVAVYKEAIAREDVSPKLRAKLFLRFSHSLAANGHWEEALEYARGAQKLAPDWDDAAHTVAKIEKKMNAKEAGSDESEIAKKHAAKGGGSVEDRLSRVEEQLAHVWKKLEAGTPRHSPEAKEKHAAAEQEMQSLREKLKRMHTDFEAEREALLKKLHALEEECAALRLENEKLRK